MGSKKGQIMEVRWVTKRSYMLQKGQIMGSDGLQKRSDSVGQMGYNKRTVWVQQVVITQPAAVALKAAGASVGFFSGEY